MQRKSHQKLILHDANEKIEFNFNVIFYSLKTIDWNADHEDFDSLS